ncbi:membrane protein [Erythrobacter sp. SG61-1L]|uniref:NfeD family protein n=1 Tax=Erythrobacter sp. SG61-1L TaxID=1603897 RepID=UPI0006C90AEC|nr:NfeD family protein [Erythrobacter sp. SG61-1L]KPL68800.1 membrane protein [Erythrobacter sp. SG61-1L]
MQELSSLDSHWAWLAIGLFLAAAEMAVPGVFLIWLAGAAIITGILAWLVPLGLPLEIVIFGVLAIVAVFLGRRYLRDNPVAEADPKMNRRGARLVGEVAIVSQPIEAGSGKVHYGDSEWLAKGADAPAGARVRITGSDGAVLLVEPI